MIRKAHLNLGVKLIKKTIQWICSICSLDIVKVIHFLTTSSDAGQENRANFNFFYFQSNVQLTFASQQSCKFPLVTIILYPRSVGRRLKSPPTMAKSHDPDVYLMNWLMSNACATRWAMYSSDSISYSACSWKPTN